MEVHIPSMYTKFIIPLITAALTAFLTIGSDESALRGTLIIAVAIAAALGQYLAANAASGFWSYFKFWVALLAVVLQSLLVVIPVGGNLGAVSREQWVILTLAILNAIATGILPNVPTNKQLAKATLGADGTPDISSLPTEPTAEHRANVDEFFNGKPSVS